MGVVLREGGISVLLQHLDLSRPGALGLCEHLGTTNEVLRAFVFEHMFTEGSVLVPRTVKNR